MNQPGRFGPFLLFQETESNRFRSCYRAGLTRGRAVERIVRLEVFDRADFDPSELLNDLEPSRRIQASLRDPHIAAGAGFGQVDAVPYAAYDFELGTTLSAFSKAARARGFPIPLDQALFIAERLALALAAAYRTESEGRPRLHSFLSPDSVLLSNLGEVKVCGFETARSLRLALHGEPYYTSYLSPQCREGQPRQAQDDVFSLGSLLYELVTGMPLAATAPDLDTIIVQATGEAAAPSLRALLHSSLAAPAQRISHALDWQRSLSKLILDGEYNPTTFNLAFLMHTLLREPLERGVESLEQEKRFVLPQGSEAPAGASAVEPAVPAADSSRSADPARLDEAASFGTNRHAPSASATDRKPFWIGFSLSAITASALLSGVLLLGGEPEAAPAGPINLGTVAPAIRLDPIAPGSGTESSKTELSEVADPGTPAVETGLVLTEVVQGQLGQALDQEEIQQTVAERTAEIERNLAAEYEQKLEALRAELIAMRDLEKQTAEAAAAEPLQDRTAVADLEDFAQAPEPEAAAAPPLGEINQVSSTRSARVQASREGSERIATGAPEPTLDAAGAPALEVSKPTTSSAEAPETDQPVVSPAELVRLKAPLYPPAARRLGLSATARVRVVISALGDVREAEIVGPELGSGFDRAALAAVRRSKWKPATREGDPVESTSVVTLRFQP